VTLPLVLAVPHAGLAIPEEVRELNRLTPEEIAADGDGGAAAIYSFGERCARYAGARVARAFLDLNRAEDDRGRDGVVKTHTCWDVPVYDAALGEPLVERLLERYHRPHHTRLSAWAREPGIRLGIDGHTMAAAGPPIGPDPGRPRPAVCLGTLHGTSCPPGWGETLAACLEESLGVAVVLDAPFAGGYTTRAHHREMPWIQIEISRAPFAGDARKRDGLLRGLTTWCRRTFGDTGS
jgi:formiminoglutamase